MKSKKGKHLHSQHMFRLTRTAAVAGMVLAGTATPAIAQLLQHDDSANHTYSADDNWTGIQLGSSTGSGLVSLEGSNNIFIVNTTSVNVIGGNGFLTPGQNGSITINGSGNQLILNPGSHGTLIGGGGREGQTGGTLAPANGAQGGSGAITVNTGNTLKINGTAGFSMIEIGGLGGYAGASANGTDAFGTSGSGTTGSNMTAAGSNGGNGNHGAINGGGDVLLSGGFLNINLGGSNSRAADGAAGGSGGAGSNGVTNVGNGLQGGQGSAGGNGGDNGNGFMKITGGNATITKITLGENGGHGGNGGSGGTGGAGSDGGDGTDATSSSDGSTGVDGNAGGHGGAGGKGGNGGNGGDGTMTITGGTFTVTSMQLGADGGTGGTGGNGGAGGKGGDGGDRGDDFDLGISPWTHYDGGDGGNGGAGGAGGNGGAGGAAGNGGNGKLTISGNGTVVTVNNALTVGGTGGMGGTGGNGYGGAGGHANDSIGDLIGANLYGGGKGGSSAGGTGGASGTAGTGELTINDRAVMNVNGLTVGGTGGNGAYGGGGFSGSAGSPSNTGANPSDYCETHVCGGAGGYGYGGSAAISQKGGDGTVVVDENSIITSSGHITVGGTGGNGSSLAGNGGYGQFSLLNGSILDAGTYTITVGGSKVSGYGGTGLFELGKNTTVTASNIIVNASETAANPAITNAQLNTTEGETRAIVSDVTVTYGQMNVTNGNLDMRGNSILLNAANSGNAEVNVQNNWLYAEELKYAAQGGKVTVDNSIMVFNTLDTSSLATSNNASFHLKNTNGVAIIGNDTSSWDSNATDPAHRAETLEWARHQIVVAGHNPASYTGGILAFRGLKDATGHAQSLDFSKLGSVGFGTNTAANKGNGGMFGQNSLTIVNAPAYVLNNNFYNNNPGNVAIIKVDAGNNNNPFEAGGVNSKLMAVLDNNTKTGDSFIVLENTGGNFTLGANDGWLKQGNAFTTSRLHTLNVWQGDGTVINSTGIGGSVTTNGSQLIGTIGGADPIMTMPGVSSEVAHLLKETASQAGHNVGDVVVNGNSISSGVHFVSRASDKLYTPDDVTSANVVEGAVRLASIAGSQAAVMRSNIASADILHGRATTFDPSIFMSQQMLSFSPDYAASDATTSASSFIEPGFGVWVMPLHQNAKIKDIEIGNTFKTGFDGKFTGLVAGFDYTTPGLMRFGVSVDGGKGDVKSTNHVQPTKNDFNYWGVSLYSGWALGPLTLSSDIGYTKTSNDISQTLPASMLMNSLKADVDNEAWAVGIRAEYQFNTPVMNIAPYAALRYMRLTTDAYSVWTDPSYSTGSHGKVFDVEKDTQDLTRVPVGVIFSKDFMTSSAFKVSPRLDLGFIYTAGDREATSVTSIPGVDATAKVKTLLVDKMTFNSTLGIDIRKTNFTLRFNYNHQNASHRSSNTFSGMVRFDF